MSEEVWQEEVAALITQLRSIRSQLAELRRKFEAEYAQLRMRYDQMLTQVAEKVLKLADLKRKQPREVINSLVLQGYMTQEEGNEVYQRCVEIRKNIPAKTPVQKRAEQEAERAAIEIERKVKEAVRSAVARAHHGSGRQDVKFWCALCDEQHDLGERRMIVMCEYCAETLDQLIQQKVFRHDHGATFRRRLKELLLRTVGSR